MTNKYERRMKKRRNEQKNLTSRLFESVFELSHVIKKRKKRKFKIAHLLRHCADGLKDRQAIAFFRFFFFRAGKRRKSGGSRRRIRAEQPRCKNDRARLNEMTNRTAGIADQES